MSVVKRDESGAAAVLAAIENTQNLLVTGHVRPDGDSLGCMIGLARMLQQAGKNAVGITNKDALGAPGFLEGIEQLLSEDEIENRDFDMVIAVDCGSFDRLPEPVQTLLNKYKTPLINIDHHCTNTLFGVCNWVDHKASSTGEMIWRLAGAAGWQLDNITAEALWVALITDTGRFAYDQTTPETMLCGADLLRHGVRTAYINDMLYCSFSTTSMELKRRAFRTLAITADNAIASVTLTGKDFQETGGTKADAEDVIEIPRSLLGNKISLFFYGNEDDQGETRVSIRTRAPLDATQLAARFGGGGHEKAAGFTLKEPLNQAKKIVTKAIQEWLAENKEQMMEFENNND